MKLLIFVTYFLWPSDIVPATIRRLKVQYNQTRNTLFSGAVTIQARTSMQAFLREYRNKLIKIF